MKEKVYLSPPALVCCAGLNRNELYESCLSGNRRGMVMTELPGTNKQFPVGLIRANLPETEKEFPFANSRIYRLINAALEQLAPAVEKALSKYGTQKIGVCFGSCDNGSEASLAAHKAFLASNAFPKNYSLTFQSGALPAEFIARKFNLCGPAFTIATACASGASAIMRGAELIQSGVCSAVIAGGADIVSPTVFSGFYALEAISDTLCNPFSKNRKGINLGEGASFFLLDSEQNSPIELLGAGESSDAHHMTAPGTDGDGPARAMKAALLDAGLKNDHIDYVNLHGTGTELNDKAEALAMKAVFDKMPPASSTKPVTGHTLGAAGALEAAICWMAVTEKRGIPVHCWDGVIDEDSPGFESGVFSDGNSGAGAPSVCMSNSFAFGGCNVSLILGER